MAARVPLFACRRLVGWSVGAILALAALSQAIFAAGAQAGEAWSAQGPANKAQAAERLLFYSAKPGVKPIKRELAHGALARRPFSPAAVSYIAISTGDAAEEGLFDVAAQLGWHDQATQRALYNHALSRGEFVPAVDRIEALLRQDKSVGAIHEFIVPALEVPVYRHAFAEAVGVRETWADRYLTQHGRSLPDKALLDIFSRRSASGTGDDLLGSVARRLLAAGRVTPVPALRELAIGDPLAVPDWEANDVPREFRWQLGNGYAVEARDNSLRRTSVVGTRDAALLLTLPVGRYRLELAGDRAVPEAWRWGVACHGSPVRAQTLFTTGRVFEIAGRCPVQTLVVAVSSRAADDTTLAPLAISRASAR